MTHKYHTGINPKKHLCCYLPTNLQESNCVVDFPSHVFHCFSARVFLSAWELVESQFSLWGPSGSTRTAEWYFHTAPRHLLLRRTPLNGIHLIKEEVGHFPVVLRSVRWGRREPHILGFLTNNCPDGNVFVTITGLSVKMVARKLLLVII